LSDSCPSCLQDHFTYSLEAISLFEGVNFHLAMGDTEHPVSQTRM
jgi:hypothetical protein